MTAALWLTAGCNPIWTETGPAESAFGESGLGLGKDYSPGSLMEQVYGDGEQGQTLIPKDPLSQTESLRQYEIGRE
ncbi:hypothetical protein DNH61_20315 [Paenibacillus sambharensis]|uniref:Uncharacterized protein n=2 Tax=Paenibacillus sambharensis TaxID=1803190 RepID=A0A2W1LPU8_9BACL|nr:hypothetical protein DNH61_20315 [Paenibacillus sambharensis]